MFSNEVYDIDLLVETCTWLKLHLSSWRKVKLKLLGRKIKVDPKARNNI
jgi:hypothetical protein